jgi:phosphoribosyl-dephospho-CoA transferase
MSTITMAELDRKLRLRRGTANALRRKGVFEAEQIMGRLWAIDVQEFDRVANAIESYRSGPESDEPTVSVLVAAMRLKVANSTIYNLVRLGRLQAVPVPNRRIHVTVSSIEDYRQRRLPVGVGIRLPKRRRAS